METVSFQPSRRASAGMPRPIGWPVRRPVPTNLDTVIIDTDENILMLIWRGHMAVRNGPHDIVSIRIDGAGEAATAAER